MIVAHLSVDMSLYMASLDSVYDFDNVWFRNKQYGLRVDAVCTDYDAVQAWKDRAFSRHFAERSPSPDTRDNG